MSEAKEEPYESLTERRQCEICEKETDWKSRFVPARTHFVTKEPVPSRIDWKCVNWKKHPAKQKKMRMAAHLERNSVEHLDLRNIARKGAWCSEIEIFFGRDEEVNEIRQTWITAGLIAVRTETGSYGSGTRVDITARMVEGATDDEHDSGYAFTLPLIGFKFLHAFGYGAVVFEGFVDPNLDGYSISNFRVPSAGYDPITGGEVCTECEEPHPIVPYLPEENVELYKRVAGKRVEVTMGIAPKSLKKVKKRKKPKPEPTETVECEECCVPMPANRLSMGWTKCSNCS